MKACILVLLVSCSHKSEPPIEHGPASPVVMLDAPPVAVELAETPITHVASCPGVRATWSGVHTNDSDRFTTLRLDIDGATKPITYDLEDIPSADWSFDIFSPDCHHVLLLQSRQGPYHVIAIARLARYAAGARPDFILSPKQDPRTETGHGNLSDGVWVSNSEVAYTWGCCDPHVTEHFVLPRSR
jgi:hypothetical protein